MDWIDEVNIDIVEHDKQYQKPTYVLVRRTSVDRFIEITKRAEWDGFGLTEYEIEQGYERCGICGGIKRWGHVGPSCPYSGGYKKEVVKNGE